MINKILIILQKYSWNKKFNKRKIDKLYKVTLINNLYMNRI